MSSEEVTFENILDRVGSRGRWQVFLFIVTSLSGFFNAFHHLGSMFLAATPDHWCTIPDSSNESAWGTNWTETLVKDYAIPNYDGEYDQCDIYIRNYSYAYEHPWSETVMSNSSSATKTCSDYTYDHSDFDETVVTRWDLVCDKAALASTVQAIYMVGVFLGALIFGLMSDRYGRRRAILIATIELIICGIAASFPVHYIWFTTFRMLTGMGAGGTFTATYVLMAEFISPRLRDVSGIAYQIPFGLGYMALPLFAYFIRTWMYLQLAISLIDLVLLTYIWILPESPRWLIGNGRFDEALPILRTAAKFNGEKGVSDKELMTMMESCYKTDMERRKGKLQQPSSLSILADLFRTPQMRKRILVSYFIWVSVAVCYYGLSFKTPSMGDNIYLTSFLSSLTEIPSYIIGCLIIRYASRKLNIMASFLLGGIFCLLILAVPAANNQAEAALAITGKFFINIAYALVYLYTTEIFPTGNRNVALGTSSMCSRLGAAGAPYIVDLMGGNTPLIIFGVASCLAGCLCFLLPETKDKYLPESVSDVEMSQTTTVESLDKVDPTSA